MAKDVVSQPQNVEKSIGAPAQTAEAMSNDSQPTAGQGKTNFSQIEGQTKSLVAAGTLPGLTLEGSSTKHNDATTKLDSTTPNPITIKPGTQDASPAKTATSVKTDATIATQANSATTIADDGKPLTAAQVTAETNTLAPMVNQYLNATDTGTQEQALNAYQAEVSKVASHGGASTRQVFSSVSSELSKDSSMSLYTAANEYTDGTPSLEVDDKTRNAKQQLPQLFSVFGSGALLTNASDNAVTTFKRETTVATGKVGNTTTTDRIPAPAAPSNVAAGGGGGGDRSAPARPAQTSGYVQLPDGSIGYDNGITTSWTNESGIHTGIDGVE